MSGKIATAVAALAIATVSTLSTLLAPAAQAHGYVAGPYSRAMACKLGLNANCGAVIYEPQSLEAPKGFPAVGPADGQIASAGGVFPELDQQSATRWYKNAIAAGPLRLDWTYTAPHRTSQWRYYMTKQGWNVDAPLKRSDLELIASVAHDGSAANSAPAHSITIPDNRSGYHVILAVWEIADTANAFYNVVDVTVSSTLSTVPSAPAQPVDMQEPTTPSGLHTMAATPSAVELMWSPSSDRSDDAGVITYVILRNSQEIGRTTSTTFIDRLTTTTSSTMKLQYQVYASDAAGNASPPSAVLQVEVSAPVAETAAWSSTARYRKGDIVKHQGSTYRCRQGYQGYGDSNWILAPSLWTRLK